MGIIARIVWIIDVRRVEVGILHRLHVWVAVRPRLGPGGAGFRRIDGPQEGGVNWDGL
jgi:hypothetical protein